jgi:hydroxyacylglutathione hydrolase
MFFRQVFDHKLAQYAYVIGCQKTGEAIVIDPQRDIDTYDTIAAAEGLRIIAVADTHIHADYLTGMREYAQRGAKVYASKMGDDYWQYLWLPDSKYDFHLLSDGDVFKIGNIQFRAIHTPGHTPEHLIYEITDLGGGADEPMGLATGDFVFVGDLGRPDLLESAAGVAGAMEPSARVLFNSVQKFFDMPDYLQVWPGHGAGSACGKALGAVPESTVGYERRFNASISAAKRGEEAFVASILEGQPEPPMYFARMKRDNRQGPKVLGTLPTPREYSVEEIKALAGDTSVALIDTRLDRSAFMASHVPGAIYAPFDKTFNTIVGSYVEEGVPMVLLIDADYVEEAVRDLVRIGLDDVVGFAPLATLDAVLAGGTTGSIEETDWSPVVDAYKTEENCVLDVRKKSEFDPIHIPGAVNIAHTRLWARHGEVPAGKKLWVHCRSGARAAVAAALLKRNGHDVVYVNDAMDTWAAQHPTVSEHDAVAA